MPFTGILTVSTPFEYFAVSSAAATLFKSNNLFVHTYIYGMVGSLDEKTRFQLLKLYDGLSNSDPDVIMDSLISMTAKYSNGVLIVRIPVKGIKTVKVD